MLPSAYTLLVIISILSWTTSRAGSPTSLFYSSLSPTGKSWSCTSTLSLWCLLTWVCSLDVLPKVLPHFPQFLAQPPDCMNFMNDELQLSYTYMILLHTSLHNILPSPVSRASNQNDSSPSAPSNDPLCQILCHIPDNIPPVCSPPTIFLSPIQNGSSQSAPSNDPLCQILCHILDNIPPVRSPPTSFPSHIQNGSSPSAPSNDPLWPKLFHMFLQFTHLLLSLCPTFTW